LSITPPDKLAVKREQFAMIVLVELHLCGIPEISALQFNKCK
jgi:hypothetical protein